MSDTDERPKLPTGEPENCAICGKPISNTHIVEADPSLMNLVDEPAEWEDFDVFVLGQLLIGFCHTCWVEHDVSAVLETQIAEVGEHPETGEDTYQINEPLADICERIDARRVHQSGLPDVGDSA